MSEPYGVGPGKPDVYAGNAGPQSEVADSVRDVLRSHKRRIDQMLDQEPGLQLIGSDHV